VKKSRTWNKWREKAKMAAEWFESSQIWSAWIAEAIIVLQVMRPLRLLIKCLEPLDRNAFHSCSWSNPSQWIQISLQFSLTFLQCFLSLLFFTSCHSFPQHSDKGCPFCTPRLNEI
jgi:hypothetical protein